MGRAAGKKRKLGAVTHDEVSGYTQTETLFKSNLFKLQTDELLREVAPFKAPLTRLEKALRELRTQLLALPAADVWWQRQKSGSPTASARCRRSRPEMRALRQALLLGMAWTMWSHAVVHAEQVADPAAVQPAPDGTPIATFEAFPPAGSARPIAGELTMVDHVNRMGMLRDDRTDADDVRPRRHGLDREGHDHSGAGLEGRPAAKGRSEREGSGEGADVHRTSCVRRRRCRMQSASATSTSAPLREAGAGRALQPVAAGD
jgi:hypothetical protein